MDEEALMKIKETSREVGEAIDQCSFKKGLRAAMNLAQYGNFYFDQNQPWVLVKDNPERCGTVLYICLRLVQGLAVCMAPYLPFSSAKLWEMLGYNTPINSWEDASAELPIGSLLERPVPLFKKLDLHDIIEETDPFSKFDLRVAKIVNIKDVPGADNLYLLQIDLGPLGKRVIVAGMKPYYSKEEMMGRSIVVVSNLKPAKIRGIESKGMLLAAEDDQGTCSLLNPQEATPGSEVFIEGIPREPMPVLEFEDFKKVEMTIDENQKAVYSGKPLQSKTHEVVSDKKIKKGSKIH